MNIYDNNRYYGIAGSRAPERSLTERPKNFSDIINEIEAEGKPKPVDDRGYRVMSGLSDIASGGPFQKAAGLARMFGNPNNPTADKVAGKISDLSGFTGDGFQKAGALSKIIGNPALAGTFADIGKWQDPKSAVLSSLTKGVGGPWGMVVGMAVQKATDDSGLKNQVAQSEWQAKKTLESGNENLARQNEIARRNNEMRSQGQGKSMISQSPFGGMFGGLV